MSDSGWIGYVGPFRFPEGEAGSRRVLGNALSIASVGYHVVVGSGEAQPESPKSMSGTDGSGSISYVGLGELLPSGTSGIAKSIRYLVTFGARTVRWLDTQSSLPQAVILYGGYSAYAFRLLAWCHRNRVPLIVDVVEWSDHRHVAGGALRLFYLVEQASVDFAMRRLFPRSNGIIAISSYLEDYYRNQGCRVVRLPPTLDVQSVPAIADVSSGPLTLAYTGIPGKKDLLNDVIEAALRIDSTGQSIRLIVAGPRPEEIARFPAIRNRSLSALPGCIKALGRISNMQAIDAVRHADFTVLIRSPLRYAQAGFPTKVPESLAVGTPVICNLTSDLGDYIHDGQEGLICQGHTLDAIMTVMERAIQLSTKQKRSMRYAARAQAEHSFDYRNYVEVLKAFLQEICG